MSKQVQDYAAYRELIRQQTLTEVAAKLAARQDGPRNPALDDGVFTPLANSTVIALSLQDYMLAVLMFADCYEAALDHERVSGQALHKGAPAFNVAVVHLRMWDFDAAMHYFELSQEETRLSYGQPNMSIYEHGLFKKDYWETMELALQADLNGPYQELWASTFNRAAAKADWKGLTDDSKLLFIFALARRIRARQIARRSNWEHSSSISLTYWNLIADLARLLETETKVKSTAPGQLYAMLTQGFKAVGIGDLSALIASLHNTHKVNDTASFNAAFPTIRTEILDKVKPSQHRISHAVYLFYASRNQVAHKVDSEMVLYSDVEAAKFTADVLFSLCHLSGWAV